MIKQLLTICSIFSLSVASLAFAANDLDKMELTEFNHIEMNITQSAENKNASLQYMSALLLALGAGQTGDKAFADFANRQLNQATYCLNSSTSKPDREISRIKKALITSNQDKFYYSSFKSLKPKNVAYGAATTEPCLINIVAA